jgi:hypothetical protein
MENAQLLFFISNHHVESCGQPPSINGDVRGQYYSYFENKYREQAIFVYDYEVNSARLFKGDAGWGAAYEVVDGKVDELILSLNETIWLKLVQPGGSLRADCPHPNPSPERRVRLGEGQNKCAIIYAKEY